MNLNTAFEDFLEYRQIFKAPKHRVFAAWTDAKILKAWWGPQGCVTHSVEVDLRVGGIYRFGMQFPTEDIFHIYGIYSHIHPPYQLVFSWHCDKPGMDFGNSIVTIDFIEHELGTELNLKHVKIDSLELRTNFHYGWLAEFEKLSQYFENKGEQ